MSKLSLILKWKESPDLALTEKESLLMLQVKAPQNTMVPQNTSIYICYTKNYRMPPPGSIFLLFWVYIRPTHYI